MAIDAHVGVLAAEVKYERLPQATFAETVSSEITLKPGAPCMGSVSLDGNPGDTVTLIVERFADNEWRESLRVVYEVPHVPGADGIDYLVTREPGEKNRVRIVPGNAVTFGFTVKEAE